MKNVVRVKTSTTSTRSVSRDPPIYTYRPSVAALGSFLENFMKNEVEIRKVDKSQTKIVFVGPPITKRDLFTTATPGVLTALGRDKL